MVGSAGWTVVGAVGCVVAGSLGLGRLVVTVTCMGMVEASVTGGATLVEGGGGSDGTTVSGASGAGAIVVAVVAVGAVGDGNRGVGVFVAGGPGDEGRLGGAGAGGPSAPGAGSVTGGGVVVEVDGAAGSDEGGTVELTPIPTAPTCRGAPTRSELRVAIIRHTAAVTVITDAIAAARRWEPDQMRSVAARGDASVGRPVGWAPEVGATSSDPGAPSFLGSQKSPPAPAPHSRSSFAPPSSGAVVLPQIASVRTKRWLVDEIDSSGSPDRAPTSGSTESVDDAPKSSPENLRRSSEAPSGDTPSWVTSAG